MKSSVLLFSIVLLSILSCSFSHKSQEDIQKDKLISIATQYSQYRKVETLIKSDERDLTWASQLCIQGFSTDTSTHYKYYLDGVHFSKAMIDQSEHGDQLYFLYVKNYEQYINQKEKQQPSGQTIVKETWSVTAVDSGYKTPKNIIAKKNEKDGKWYIPKTRSHLYIMYKEAENAGNDKGWVYGIIDMEESSNPKVMISHEKISSCIRCHTESKYDRIFGL